MCEELHVAAKAVGSFTVTAERLRNLDDEVFEIWRHRVRRAPLTAAPLFVASPKRAVTLAIRRAFTRKTVCHVYSFAQRRTMLQEIVLQQRVSISLL
jgi:hypothetical protein